MQESGGFFLEFEEGVDVKKALSVVQEKVLYIEGWDPDIDENMIGVSDECPVEYDDFEGILEKIAKAVAKAFPESVFHGEAYYEDHDTKETAYDCIDYKAGTLIVENRFAETEGICPECGEEAFDLAEYYPEKRMKCPECGFPHDPRDIYRVLPEYERKELHL